MSQRQDPRLNLFHLTGGVARRIVFTAHQVGALRFRVASDRDLFRTLFQGMGTLLTSDSKDSASSSLKDDAVAHGTTPNRSSGGARNPH